MQQHELDLALLILRVAFGASLAAHGAQKLFGWWNGPGISGFAGWLASMRMPAPKASALLAALGEFGGGLLLATGLLTGIGALGMVTVMLTAIATVHLAKGFFVSDGGFEYNLAIVAGAVTVAITGPGQWSLDDVLGLDGDGWHGWEWGLGVLVAGLVLTALNLAARTKPAVEARSSSDPGGATSA
jgi:putative oxidoreductase